MIVDMNYWTKVIRKLIILGSTVIGIYLSFKLAIFYMPFLIAFIISLIIEPLIKKIMKNFKVKRKTSSLIVFIVVIGIIIGLLAWGITTLITEASSLLQNLNSVITNIYKIFQDITKKVDYEKIRISPEVSKVLNNSTADLIDSASEWVKIFLTTLINTLTSLPTIFIYILITLLALYFICSDKIYMIDQLEHHLPTIWVKKITKHMRDLIKSLGCYLKAEITLILISFIISVVGLYLFKIFGLNIQYPLIAAIGIAFVDALPIFGSGTVMIPWSIIVACNGDLKLGLSILILWGLMSVIRQVLEPRIVSKQIGIHPIFTLISMYTGFKIIGILGMILGPIILIILKNIFANTIDKGFLKCIFDRDI